MANGLLNVVLCWHMHQPHYREGVNGDFHLPWVYLHGIKDYTDMAFHLENHPGMHAVVNFSPVLIEQLDLYVAELDLMLNDQSSLSNHLSDPLLSLLAGVEEIPQDISKRKQIIADCKRCYAPRMIDPYPAFKRLIDCLEAAYSKAGDINKKSGCTDADEKADFPLLYLQDQYFIDLLVWYHLAWLGESVKKNGRVEHLFVKEQGYTLEDRYELTSTIHEALAGIIPRYRKLAQSGQVELSLTPYAHPIVPLLNDFENMQCAQPEAPVPNCDNYPEGAERSRWHMQTAFELFEQHFGFRPKGVWLSEGGVSEDAMQLLDQFQVQWTATGESVWRNTCKLVNCDPKEVDDKRGLFRPYVLDDIETRLYFRDDGLSDFIGFEYSHWNAADAASHFRQNLENISHYLGEDADQYTVSVILDGENAWEYYIENGSPFLDALYRELTSSDLFRMTTFSHVSETIEPHRFDKLCSGSWVYGSFSTWIGQRDKNRAWEHLVALKKVYDKVMARNKLSPEQRKQAELQLAICEGSDWFWWFGDYNSANSVSDFDRLFRLQLKTLYQTLGQKPPAVLDSPISVGGGNAENSGTMRRNK